MINLSAFTIGPDQSVYDALIKINANKKGFVILADEANIVEGVLTDGDIRRAFIEGGSTGTRVDQICTKDFRFLELSDELAKAVDLFKNASIKFIPLLDHGALENILTKPQLQSLLLLDIHADLRYDFSLLDENIVNYEIYHKPWGFYKTTVMNDYYQSKIISVNPKAQLSLQSHDHREEYWIVAHGHGSVQLDQSFLDIRCGSSVFIPRVCRHRLINTDPEENLIITEVQLGDYFGEDDIIRYEDLYGRK